MTTTIFDKTDKGREEIATRKYHLASRLRTLLVLIDGKNSGDDLLKKLAGMGLDETSVAELQRDGFIHETGTGNVQTSSAPAAANDAASNPLPPGQNQFEAIYHFYNETIKSTVGLRGYPLQLKVERANSIEDFRKLRQHYLEVVQKAKGHEMARSLRDRLDQLLYLGETVPPDTVLNELNAPAK
ncbi:MAG: hypothetical protein ABI351_05860 [Herbaspirillum sp.]